MLVVRSIGWGIVAYSLIQLLWNILRLHGVGYVAFGTYALYMIIALTVGLVAYAADARSLKEAAAHSLVWVAVVASFDGFLYFPLNGSAMWRDPYLWIGYAVVCASPLVVYAMGWLASSGSTIGSK